MSDIFDFIDEMKTDAPKDKVFNFKQQMALGDIGEKDFITAYKNLAPKKSHKDLAFDFTLKDGKTVELKTDDYSMNDSPNFFMETISDTKSGKVGGPSRAYKDGVDYFVYYFLRNHTYFWFDTRKLYEALQPLIASGKYKLKSIKNNGWTAEGYAIPRHTLKSVLMQEDYCP